jgi:hypothetical protein
VNAVLRQLAHGPVEALFRALLVDVPSPRPSTSESHDDDDDDNDNDLGKIDGRFNDLASSLRRCTAADSAESGAASSRTGGDGGASAPGSARRFEDDETEDVDEDSLEAPYDDEFEPEPPLESPMAPRRPPADHR